MYDEVINLLFYINVTVKKIIKLILTSSIFLNHFEIFSKVLAFVIS